MPEYLRDRIVKLTIRWVFIGFLLGYAAGYFAHWLVVR
jgi:hypothetical protein